MKSAPDLSRQRSIATFMVFVLVGVVTLVLGFAGALLYRAYSDVRWSKLRSDLSMDADQLAVGLALPVWNIDRDQIDKIIESAMKNRTMYSVEVTAAGRTHARKRDSQWKVVEGTHGESMIGLLSQERDITFSNEIIGSVRAFATERFVTEDLRSSVASIVVIIFTLDVLLTFGLYLMLWRIVLKPLQAVERYAVDVSSGNRPDDEKVGRRFRGELESLRSSLEKMVLLLDERYAQLQKEVLDHRESEERFRSLIEQAPVAISISRNGTILYTNPMYCQMFNIQNREECLGRPAFSYLSARSQEESDERARRRLAGLPAPNEYEAMGLRRDGVEFPLYVSVAQVSLADGPAFIAFITDITVRKASEDALRESEARYRALIEYLPNGIVISKEDKLIFVNPAAASLLNIPSPGEVVGRSIEEFVDDDFQDRLRERRRRVMETGEPAPLEEYNVKRTDGTIVAVEGQGVRITLDREPALMNSFRDITIRKKAEEALKNSMEQLHLITARLENIREEERRFISHEVHDELGQVLTALKMDLIVLKRTGAADRRVFDDRIQSMLSLTDSAVKTVQDISTKLRPGMLDDLGLVAAVEWATEDFQKRAGVSCSLTLPDTDLGLDDKRSTVLFRILQEALTNVARHAHANNVEVTLSESDGEVLLSVMDDGVGIAEDQIENTKSIGLLGIRERLHPFRGICTIQRRVQGGTALTIHLPKIL